MRGRPAPRGSWADRLLRRLVCWLPADFRSDYGDAIQADLAARRRDGDRAGLLRHDIPSLAGVVVREHAVTLGLDLRDALRTLYRTPGFTALAVLMLALGTGVNAAVFSVIDAVVLRLPFDQVDRIAMVLRVNERGRAGTAFTAEQYAALEAGPGPFSAIGAEGIGEHVITGPGGPRRIETGCVSASMFDVLGTKPALGRLFGPSDDRRGAAPLMVLSHAYWRRLGSPPGIVGSTLIVNQNAVMVAGVMPPGFGGVYDRATADAWLPLSRPVAGGGRAGCSSALVFVHARIAEGLTLDAARARVPQLRLLSLDERPLTRPDLPFLALAAAVGCVLLIACFNVAGLQMERSLAQRREFAVRVALGASRGRLVRRTLTENVVLALVGAAAGLVGASVAMGAVVSLLPADLPRLDEIGVNGRVALLTMTVAFGAGLIAGVVPVALSSYVDPVRDLKPASRFTDRRGGWVRRTLVTAEIALSVVVLIGAGLMIQTFLRLRPIDTGFDASNKVSLEVGLGGDDIPTGTLVDDLVARLRGNPDIRNAAGSSYIPMSGFTTPLVRLGADENGTNTIRITPGYFDLMKIARLQGRAFTAADTRGTEPVVIVNEVLARRIHRDGAVVGQSVLMRWGQKGGPPEVATIVGVVANSRTYSRDLDARAELYVPNAQRPAPRIHLIVEAAHGRKAHAAPAVVDTVRTARPDVPLDDVLDLDGMLWASQQPWRFGAWLLGVFASLAILLAAIGLMTTLGWWVHQRTQELGIRVALGASRWSVMRLVLGQGLSLAAAGIVIGTAAAAGLTRYLESWVYGVTPLDTPTFVVAAAGMILVAAGAIYVPVRRATTVDPVLTLRTE